MPALDVWCLAEEARHTFLIRFACMQAEIFQAIGLPIGDACMAGYNGTIFAYGQTGAGKTFTMYGPPQPWPNADVRGLAPRVIEHIFSTIAKEARMHDRRMRWVGVSMLCGMTTWPK